MKKLLCFSVLACFFIVTAGIGHAGKTVTIPADAYQKLLKRLDQLEKKTENSVTISKEEYQRLLKRIEILEKEQGKSQAELPEGVNPSDIPNTALMPSSKTTTRNSSTWYDKGLSFKDRVNLGAELRARVDFIHVNDHFGYVYDSQGRIIVDSQGFPLAEKKDVSNDNHWTSRYRLNLDADVTENITFHGRLAVYQNWGDSKNRTLTDMAMAHIPDDSTLKLDRFYVDWQLPMTVPLAVSVGRLPTTEGPPLQLREFRMRQAVFPALLLDAELNGLVVSLGLEDYTGWENSGLRFLYSKSYEDSDDLVPYLDSRSALDDTNIYGLQLEGSLPFLDKSLLTLSALWATDMNANGVELGNMAVYGIHTQVCDIMDSGLDLFFSWALNNSDPNGNFGVEDYPLALPDGSTGKFSIPVGMLTNDGKDDRTGWAIYAGLRYRLPISMLRNPKLGFEYNYGSKYWYSLTPASLDLINRLSIRGNSYDFYYIQPFNRYITMRTGFNYIDFNYDRSGSFVGKPLKVDDSLRNFYVLFDCRF